MIRRSGVRSELYVGLMSGTSLDGVDAALVDFSEEPPRLVATHFAPYPAEIRAEALALNAPGPNELDRAARLGVRLADAYAQAVRGVLVEGAVGVDAVSAVGCHGQTVRHRPELGYTVQVGNGARLAELLGVRVVSDFRSRDIAAGGQGAPLVPAFHEAVFATATAHRVIVNIGGIANLTSLPPAASKQAVIGFDTGPGNVLLDLWAAAHTGESLDVGGRFAARGKPDDALLATMLADPYFAAQPPKSTGRDRFNRDWLEAILRVRVRSGGALAPEDVQATLSELTARSIAEAIETHCAGATEIFLCGGGVHNGDLVGRIGRRLPRQRVASTDELGIDPDWVEAFAFAWLARSAIMGQTGNLPNVTGAAGRRVLGAIYPA